MDNQIYKSYRLLPNEIHQVDQQVVELDLPEKLSTNKIYEGVHWAVRKQHKDLFLWAFVGVASKIHPVESCDLEFEFEFTSKPLDCDNCSYMTKLLIDCLRHFNKIKDDTPEYIRSVKITSRKGSKNRVIIKICG